MLDTVGNLLLLLRAPLASDVAAVVCSLYPAGTGLLAALVLKEQPTALRWPGWHVLWAR